MNTERKQHWEHVYKTKSPEQVSWTQEVPKTSLELIRSFQVSKDANIIDIGGGDSKLVDHLLADGYTNITVLDISDEALERAKKRLGDNASLVTWIVSDIITFIPPISYDVWHDRAVFHFLTEKKHIEKYISLTEKHITKNLVIGTFSKNGPLKCSGLEITQYSRDTMSELFKEQFQLLQSIEEVHHTPFNTTQDFIFCSFRKHETYI